MNDDDDDDDNIYTYYMLKSLYIYIPVYLCIYIAISSFFIVLIIILRFLIDSSVSIILLNIIDIRNSLVEPKQQFNKALSYYLELLHPNTSYRQAGSYTICMYIYYIYPIYMAYSANC